MKILITGANGMVAKALTAHCVSLGDDVLALSREDLDITRRKVVASVIEDARPDVVINCAAYTDVDGSEENNDTCIAVNSDGVENLALASKDADCGFVTISTDYVFDGAKQGFYTQKDTPNPLGVYGSAKLEGEQRATATYARSSIVRAGWIYGIGGTNFLSVMGDLLRDGREISAISDSYGVPTFTDDLAKQLRAIAELDMPLIFHVANTGERASFYDFAKLICKEEGIDPGIVKETSAASLMRPARRPVNTPLRCLFSDLAGLNALPHWKDSLKKFLARKKTQAL